MKSVLGLSLNKKNSESEMTVKKTFVLKSRIVKALWAYYMMGVVYCGRICLFNFFYC